jgi:iron complex outermembrane receptor protein
VHEKVNTNNFSWKLGAQYTFNPNLMTYFTATRGYKGPAVNDQASPPIALPIVQSEIPMYYELGLKGSFFDGKLATTIALFHNKVKNFQTSIYIPPSATNPVGNFAQGNAPYIISKGVEADFMARPIEGLSLNGGLIYNPAKYSANFIVGCTAQTVNCPTTGPNKGVVQAVPQLAQTPKWRILLNGQYEREIRSGLTGYVQSDLTFSSSQFLNPAPDPVLTTPAHWLLGARVGVRDTAGRWGLSLFSRNLLNKSYPTPLGDALSGFDGGNGQSYWVAPYQGRTFGITIDARY